MSKLTEKQQRFAANKAAGVKNREAAIAAGYSCNTADVQAANLLRRPAIKAAIKAASGPASSAPSVLGSPAVMQRKSYTDPVSFLEDAMNNPQLPVAMRVDAAKSLLPYKHARLGDKGKKEHAKERAQDVASRARFRPKAPPALRAMAGGRGREE